MSVTAPTGFGKSLLVTRGLMPLWRWVLTFDVKGDDPELRRAAGPKVEIYPDRWALWRARDGEIPGRFRMVPGGLGERARYRVNESIAHVWGATRSPKPIRWTLYLDETRVLSDKLRMRSNLETLWIMGRSSGLTVIASTQAPRFVPTEYYDQPRWHFIGPFRDRRTLDRMAEIGGDTDMIRDVIPDLEWSDRRREFLVLGPDRYAAITSYDLKGGR
jgi:hypothetical protein